MRQDSVPTQNAVKSVEFSSTPSAWNNFVGKRLLDLACATLLLVLISPVLLVIALLVKCTSAGPVFYRQTRVGRHGVPFTVVKFRSMTSDVEGPGLTRSGDRRVSRVGRLVRKWKLDELPQLVNVVAGHMSLVGPRPDLPQYIQRLPAELRQVLQLLPGVTGAASLRYRHEEYLLSQVAADHLDEFYCSELLPDKVRLDLEYAEHASLMTDLAMLFRTVRSLWAKAPVPLAGTSATNATTIAAANVSSSHIHNE